MPTFTTPSPINLRVDLPFGDARIIASDRDTTVVDVVGDDTAIRVTATGDEVTVTTAGSASDRGLLGWGLGPLGIGPDTDVSVTIELPAGSRVAAATRYGSVSTEGVGVVEGFATITDKHSDIAVVEALGPLHLRGTHGEVSVGRVLDGVVARNAYGGVQVDELVAGACDVATTYGEVEIGIAEGTAAWLDVGSDTGTVHSRLDEQTGPQAFDRTCEVHARTRDGDIVVRRARRPAEAAPRFWRKC